MSDSHLCISRNETAQPRYFQNRIIMFYLPILTLIYVSMRDLYFQDRSVYFAAARYVDRSWEYINPSQTWMLELGLRWKYQFSVYCACAAFNQQVWTLLVYICICTNFSIMHGRVVWRKYFAIPFCRIMALQDESILYKITILLEGNKIQKGT